MPADDNQNNTSNTDSSLDEKVRSGSLPFESASSGMEDDKSSVSMTSGIGADEMDNPSLSRPNLSEPGLPPLPDIEEKAPPPPPGNLPMPNLEMEDKDNGVDLGAKGVGMMPNGGDKPLEAVAPKKKSKAGLIAGVMALLLLVAGAGVAVLNFDLFRGDIRQRASGGTCGSQCNSDGECGGGTRCVANVCKICSDSTCSNAYCPAAPATNTTTTTQSPYYSAGYGFWNIGGLPHSQDINYWDVCYEITNPCAPNTGSDAWCGCNPVNLPSEIGCLVEPGQPPRSAQVGSPTRVVNGQGTACRPATTPTPTTPAAICGDNICNAGETCENGARRADYSGTGDPGSWQCLSSDIGKAPSGVRVGECRFPGSPFGAPYCAQSPSATPTPVAMCIEVKGWVNDPGNGCLPQVGTSSGCIAGDWKAATPAQLATAIRVGNTVRFTVKGSNATFTKARFSVNNGAWVESTSKYGADFYYDYPVTQSGPISVKAELWK